MADGRDPLDGEAARAVAAEHATAGDERRVFAPEVLEALLSAGFARHLVPGRWDGVHAGFAELTDAVANVGQGCTSAAWLASLFAYSARLGAYLPDEGQSALWAKGPDAVISAALVPGGSAEQTTGGWRVSGQWPYTSGVEMADWALVCVRRDDPDGPMFVAVPRTDFSTVDTWHTLGMRATASNTLILDDVLVAPHLVFRSADAAAGRSVAAAGPTFEIPLRAISGLTFAAPLLGAARGALADFLHGTRSGTRLQTGVARAAGEIDAAALLLERAAAMADRGGVTPEEVARSLRDTALAASFLVSSVDRLVTLAGTAGQSDGRPLQRFWRDIHTASSHVALRFDKASAAHLDLLERGISND